ncbi:MAG: hypothetical protein K2W82_16665 [Candidatus Obscuribacterales bacterium]|nr:hypothetical protein [Candidatus Obscuribacterales bacterium]
MTTNFAEVLPIAAFRNAIMTCNAPYIIVEAETGAGKSTEVPRWLMHAGHRALVAEPLVETVIGTGEYAASLEGEEVGSKIGYRTGSFRKDSPDSRILYATTELTLIRELCGHNRRFDTLVIDELHEWRLDQSVLEAWSWQGLLDGTTPFKKVIVLSATIDSAELSRQRGNAPVFRVPGRQHPIEDRQSSGSLIMDVRGLVSENFDVLVFMPGKAEIDELLHGLQKSGIDAELIPFHGGLERGAKDRAYRSYGRPKVVVSTNALETGRTLLPSKGRQLAVVDSGMERRKEVVGGVEGLYLKPIAKARAKQRRGRTGRVSEGVYIDCCPEQGADRAEYPTPEIQRVRLDQMVLRVARAGFDAESLPFFHQPSPLELSEARETLKMLGCMDAVGKVTTIGDKVAQLPMGVGVGRALVEAEKLGVTDDVLTVAAIMETGELTDHKLPFWGSLVAGEDESDALAQLAVFKAVCDRRLTRNDMEGKGIRPVAYYKARDQRQRLVEALRGKMELKSTGKREDIIRSVVAGMLNLLYQGQNGCFGNAQGVYREQTQGSVVMGATLVVGQPWDLEVKGKFGFPKTLRLLRLVTEVTPQLLVELAPHLVQVSAERSGMRYDSARDACVSYAQVSFAGRPIGREEVVDSANPGAAELFADWATLQMC